MEPPYTVFDGQTVVFFDFLTPGAIYRDDGNRISDYNKIGLEAVQNHLKRIDLADRFDHNDVEVFAHCTVCRKTQYEDYPTGSGEKEQILDLLEQESCIATVSSGGELSLASGELHDNRMSSLLGNGIPVPETRQAPSTFPGRSRTSYWPSVSAKKSFSGSIPEMGASLWTIRMFANISAVMSPTTIR